MPEFICMHCGGNEVVRDNDLYICQHCDSKYRAEQADVSKSLGEVLLSMNRYKNRMIEAVAETKLFPKRSLNLQKKIDECRFYESEKKTDLNLMLIGLEKNRKKDEDSIDKIKTDAYLLMKRHSDSPPARDIWENTFEHLVTEYVEKCYLDKDGPNQEDKDELNLKLFPIGFGYEYYSRSGMIESRVVEKYSRIYGIFPDPVEQFDSTSRYTEGSRINLMEYILAAFLFGAAIVVFIHFMVNDPYGNPFDITGMGIIGGIGLVASLLCMGFEGAFPVSIKGLLACSVFLVFAMEFPITTPILLFMYVVCIYSLIISYGGRMSGVVLGSVAIICLPFWGVILGVLIGMLLGGGTRRSNGSRKDKR